MAGEHVTRTPVLIVGGGPVGLGLATDLGWRGVKCLLVDDLWAVVGTTNFDNRSFEHNDEVNVAFRDESVNTRLSTDFERDLSRSREITLEAWRERPLWEKLIGTVAWILERQQ